MHQRNSWKQINLIFPRSEEHTSELQSRPHLVCRLLLEKKKSFVGRIRHDFHRTSTSQSQDVEAIRHFVHVILLRLKWSAAAILVQTQSSASRRALQQAQVTSQFVV